MDDATEPAIIRVMVFNIEYGGTGVDFDKVIEAIQAADPDIVALEEAMGNTARIAVALGWPSASARTHVLSCHPLLEPADAGGLFTYVEIEPGRIVAIVNVHLPAEPFGPALLTAGGSDQDAIALENRVRLPALERSLAALGPLTATSVPVFVLGDFNAPLDLGWPVSRAIEAAGLRDTWREIHPDPRAEPGLTWPAARPAIGRDDPVEGAREDRIDAIFAMGPSITLDSRIVGESGRPDVALSVDPWPSDHRAIVALAAVDDVALAVGCVDRVGAVPADQHVGTGAAGQHVVARAAVDAVVARAAEQRVVAAAAEDHVVEAAPGEIVAVVRTDDAAPLPVRR